MQDRGGRGHGRSLILRVDSRGSWLAGRVCVCLRIWVMCVFVVFPIFLGLAFCHSGRPGPRFPCSKQAPRFWEQVSLGSGKGWCELTGPGAAWGEGRTVP